MCIRDRRIIVLLDTDKIFSAGEQEELKAAAETDIEGGTTGA